VAGHPLQRPRRRTERHQVRRHRGSAIIDAAPGNVNGENNTPFKLQASLENVQEFRVESSSYPAEYGTGTGGQVSVVTKSGGNAFHGALFEYSAATSSTRRTTSTRRATRRQRHREAAQVEAQSEPVRRLDWRPARQDRRFFFGSYEGYRLDAGLNFIEGVPSAAAGRARCRRLPPLRRASPPGRVILTARRPNPTSTSRSCRRRRR
jgi:hypothetical protein